MADLNRLFTGIPDVDRETFLRLNDDQLKQACILDRYTVKLCNQDFWRRRYTQEFGPLPTRLANNRLTSLQSLRSDYWELANRRKRQRSLLSAVESGDVETVHLWAEENDGDEWEIMSAAIEADRPELLELIIEEHQLYRPRPSINVLDAYDAWDEGEIELWHELLNLAIDLYRSECFRVLIEMTKIDITEVEALSAVNKQNLEIISLVLDYSGDEHIDQMLEEALLDNNAEIITYLEAWIARHQ